MTDVSNETLAAHADGELDVVQRARLDAILAHDPVVRARLEVFKSTGKSIGKYYDPILDEPVPAHLVNLVMSGGKQHYALPGRSVPQRSGSIMAAILAAAANALPRIPVALAYSAVLLAGAGAGWYLRGANGPASSGTASLVVAENGFLYAKGDLRNALETSPSTMNAAENEGRQATPIIRMRLSFRTIQHEFCRHYIVTPANLASIEGIACRGKDGNWRVTMQAQAAAGSNAGDQTIIAGGYPVVEAVVDRMIDGDALDTSDEQKLIGGHWRN